MTANRSNASRLDWNGRRLRTLFVQSATEIGGAEMALLTMLKNFDRSRLEPYFASLEFGDGDLPEEVERLGIPVFHLPRGPFRNFLSTAAKISSLRRLIREHEIDIVLSNGGHSNLFARPAAVLSGRPCAWWVHMYDDSSRSEGRKPIARAERVLGASALFANSEYTARLLQKDFSGGPVIRVVRPGVDFQRSYPAPEEGAAARSQLGVPVNEPLVGMFGRLQRGKGQHVFLQAAAVLAERNVPCRFLVVGNSMFGLEPEYADELRRFVEQKGLSSEVQFLGYRKDSNALMNACDIVVHAAVEPESWGLAVAEAMAAGRPVVATAAGGPLEMIDPGRTGLLVPPRDRGELASTIEDLLRQPELRRQLGEAARRRALEAYDPLRAAAILTQELERL